MKGLDLSNFKKVKADAKSATLQHPDGHKIIISVASLSPKMQKELHGLPFAEGGKVDHCKCDEIEGDNPACKRHSHKKIEYKEQPASKDPGKPRSGVRPIDLKTQKYADGGSPVIDPSQVGGDVTTSGDPLYEAVKSKVKKIFSSDDEDSKAKGGKVVKKYAEGSDNEPVAEADSAPIEVEKIEDTPEGKTEQKASIPPQDLEQPEQVDASVPEPAQEQPVANYDQGGNQGGVDPTLQANGMPRPNPQQMGPPSPGAELLDERNKWVQDLANQHITPETYHSLFAKKDTLGKIGTIFGLMISGIGSGLAGQPNALLKMMDNQIERDLDAQKHSKANAQSFLKLQQSQALNDATINNLVKQGKLTDSQAESMKAETQIKNITSAKLAMQVSALHDLMVKNGALPPGPLKQKGTAVLNALGQQIDSAHAQEAAKADTAIGQLRKSAGINPEQQFANEQQMYKFAGMPDIAEDNESHHIPGVPGRSARPVPEELRQRIQAMGVLDNKGRDVLSYIKQHTGSWNPQTRAVAQQKIEEMKNFYNDSIKGGALTQGRLGWYDEQFAKHPTDILAQLMGSTAKLNEVVNSNSNRRNLELKGLGYDTSKTPIVSNSPSEGSTSMSKGKPIVFKNGKWQYK